MYGRPHRGRRPLAVAETTVVVGGELDDPGFKRLAQGRARTGQVEVRNQLRPMVGRPFIGPPQSGPAERRSDQPSADVVSYNFV